MSTRFVSVNLKAIALNNAKKAAGNIQTLPINVFSHLVSSKHKKLHRFAYGAAVIIFGTMFAQSKEHFNSNFLHIVFEGGGYMIHAIGCTPFIDHFAEKVKELKG